MRFTELKAVLFDAGAMMPLSMLTPARIESTSIRYVLPDPIVLDPRAPLGLGPIEFRGPLTVRYTLPAGCQRFAAHAVLPESCRTWGDFELIILDEDEVVYRVHLNAEHPEAAINVPVMGSELSIELRPGAYGPIQDQLLLHRAMLLVGE